MEDWDERPQVNIVKSTVLGILTVIVLTHPMFVQLTGFDITELALFNRSIVEEVNIDHVVLNESRGALKTGQYFNSLSGHDKDIYLTMLDWANGVSERELIINKENHPNPGNFYESMIKIYRMVILDNPHYHPERQAIRYNNITEASAFGIDQVTLTPAEAQVNLNMHYYDDIMTEVVRINNETGGMSDFQKVQYFYRYLVENVTYEDGEEAVAHSPVGALLEHEAVCEGIAKSLKMLCDYADIPCIVVVTNDHAWNAVNLNGDIYHFDATWDLGRENWRFFMLTYEELMLIDPEKHKLYFEGYEDIQIYF